MKQLEKCINLRFKMFPPRFFSLKILTTGLTGKELRWTSFKIDGWIARGVIKSKHMIYILLKNMPIFVQENGLKHYTCTGHEQKRITFLSDRRGETHGHTLDHS